MRDRTVEKEKTVEGIRKEGEKVEEKRKEVRRWKKKSRDEWGKKKIMGLN